MGALSGVARLLLVVVNIIFLLIGLALTAVGFVLRYATSLYEDKLDKALDLLKSALDGTNLGNFDPKTVDLGSIVEGIAIGLIVGGIILVAITVIGCCGACYKAKFLLWLYAIITIVFLVVEIVAISLLYGKPDIVKDGLKDTLEKYKGLAGSDITSVGWNVIMIEFECCGVDNYEDFNVSTQWTRHPKALAAGAAALVTPLVTPLACCKTLPNSIAAFSCATDNKLADNNGETGCYDTIWDKSFGNNAIAVPVLVICGIVQIAFIIFAFIIIKSKNGISPL